MTKLAHQCRIDLYLLLPLMIVMAACSDMPTSMESAPASPLEARVAPAADAAAHEYKITIDNLTGGQPFSPGVVITHARGTHLFEVGETASEGIRLIAENGDPSAAIADLQDDPDVHAVQPTAAAVGPRGSLTVHIAARANANRLSFAAMLVCTNDGFVGLESVKLPGVGTSATFRVNGYDAGTELNEETSETIVDGCGLGADGNARTATDDAIMHHPGIKGAGDLDPAAHGWTDPAARITIERIQ